MASIKWCLKQKLGLKLVEPNENMSSSYIKMAEESIKALSNLKDSDIWIATTSYYIFYYSLYSFMLRLGVKCEIHSCSLEFMKQCLKDFYSEKDIGVINKAFSARINLQYYADRKVESSDIDEIKVYCKNFFIKTKEILMKIKEEEIKDIRGKLND